MESKQLSEMDINELESAKTSNDESLREAEARYDEIMKQINCKKMEIFDLNKEITKLRNEIAPFRRAISMLRLHGEQIKTAWFKANRRY